MPEVGHMQGCFVSLLIIYERRCVKCEHLLTQAWSRIPQQFLQYMLGFSCFPESLELLLN